MRGIVLCIFIVSLLPPPLSLSLSLSLLSLSLSLSSLPFFIDKLYAIGGETTQYCYKSVEEYDPVTNTWTIVPDMHTARSGAGAAALDGRY